jgi:arylsulfatase
MTTKAVQWVRQQEALMPEKPFFMYFAPGATHAPHHVPAEWATSTRASSIRGGTGCGRRPLQRQKALGVIPGDAELTPRPDEIPAWADMPDN